MENAGNKVTEFPALSVDPRVGISWSALETDDCYDIKNHQILFIISFVYDILHCITMHSVLFVVANKRHHL